MPGALAAAIGAALIGESATVVEPVDPVVEPVETGTV